MHALKQAGWVNDAYAVGTSVKGAFVEQNGEVWYPGIVIGNILDSIVEVEYEDKSVFVYYMPTDCGELTVMSSDAHSIINRLRMDSASVFRNDGIIIFELDPHVLQDAFVLQELIRLREVLNDEAGHGRYGEGQDIGWDLAKQLVGIDRCKSVMVSECLLLAQLAKLLECRYQWTNMDATGVWRGTGTHPLTIGACMTWKD